MKDVVDIYQRNKFREFFSTKCNILGNNSDNKLLLRSRLIAVKFVTIFCCDTNKTKPYFPNTPIGWVVTYLGT